MTMAIRASCTGPRNLLARRQRMASCSVLKHAVCNTRTRAVPDPHAGLLPDPDPEPAARDNMDISSADWTDLLEVINRERLKLEGQRTKTLSDMGDAIKHGARRELDTTAQFVSSLRVAIARLVVMWDNHKQ